MDKMVKPIKAVVFDFDGTLTQPGALDFSMIKRELGCPADFPVLEFIQAMADARERSDAMEALDRFEIDAAARSRPNPGAEGIVRYLKERNVALGILSRNSLGSIERAFDNFDGIGPDDFDLIVSRDTPVAPKPSPDSVLHAARELGVPVSGLVMVGDYLFDIQAGNRAGAITVLLTGDKQNPPFEQKSDHVISSFKELEGIVRLGLPLAAGKFPNDLLSAYLDEFMFEDPSVLINPGVGEDIAAVDVASDAVLVLKSDPITFATDAIGQYAVIVNANDIATSGADPRWLLTTLMFPCGVTAAEVFQTMRDLKSTCEHWGITLCGGHTEITDAVTRPVVTGMMAGTVSREALIDKADMRAGDQVLLTKAVAVEGTSIIAREFDHRLRQLGVSDATIDTCRRFLDDISILAEARIARQTGGVSAMHDVTEGGVATALEELSTAGGHRVRVELGAIPIFPQTEEICRLLRIDPLGLIGSGSLLICCRPDGCAGLIQRIEKAGIAVTRVGEVLGPGQGIEARKDGGASNWPRFAADEIARLFQTPPAG